jgi:hypothetical protein
LYTQAIFGQSPDRYFFELNFQNLRAELLLVQRALIESPLKDRNSLVYHTLTPDRLLLRTPITEKYGNGDSTDASRAAEHLQSRLVTAWVRRLPAQVFAVSMQTGEAVGLASARVRCVDAFFTLLGSMPFRRV